MRVNIYAEEITTRVELVKKGEFTGVRFYLELPVALQTPPTKLGEQPGITHVSGPFVHHAGDDDSSAVTFWGKRALKGALIRAVQLIDQADGPATSAEIAAVSEKLNHANKVADMAQGYLAPAVDHMVNKFAVGDFIPGMGRMEFRARLRDVIQQCGGRVS